MEAFLFHSIVNYRILPPGRVQQTRSSLCLHTTAQLQQRCHSSLVGKRKSLKSVKFDDKVEICILRYQSMTAGFLASLTLKRRACCNKCGILRMQSCPGRRALTSSKDCLQIQDQRTELLPVSNLLPHVENAMLFGCYWSLQVFP